MARAHRRNLNNLLFSLFWWMLHKVSPSQGGNLLYWGLQSGAFPNTSVLDKSLTTDFFGHTLHTPVGIGSGFDVKANVIDDLIFMGAGFGEFGPYTLEYENPTMETRYLKKDKSIVVESLGYKNPGLVNMVSTFTNRRYLPNVVGIAITSTAYSEGENIKMGRHMTYEEELSLMARKIAPFCDYITLDFSHPETGLSSLVSDESGFVAVVRAVRKAIGEAAPVQTPHLFVKLPIDLTSLELPIVTKNLIRAQVDAVIVGEPLSLFHTPVKLSKNIRAGMLSGKAIKPFVIDKVSKIRQFTNAQVPIIAHGGIFSGQDAYDMIAAGASYVEIGTVLKYDGPSAITKINKELAAILKAKGFTSVQQAIGADYR